MPLKVVEERKYQRYIHTKGEGQYLRSKGLTPVVSSNVSAIGRTETDLLVRFHGGATYKYLGQAELFNKMWASSSKGRFVWNVLRNKGIPYVRLGNVNIKDDIEDKDMMKPDVGENILLALSLTTMMKTQEAFNQGLITSLTLAREILNVA